ncbi:MAG: DUF721 domain-containing protein [Fimbriimonas sp.]
MMKKLGFMLGDAVEQSEILRAARARTVLERWPEVVGNALAERSMPDRYVKGVVYVAVTGSAWAQEMRLMREDLLHRMHEIAGERGLFTDLRFGVRPVRPLVVHEPEEDLKAKEEARLSELRPLSIREIAARRLANWPKDMKK